MVKVMPLQKEDMFSSFTLNVTSACNLYCLYCLRNSGPKENKFIDVENAKNILLFFYRKNRRGCPLFVQITGGEIFTHPNLFKILKYAVSLGYTLRLQTNGTLLPKLSKNQLSFLSNANAVFKVSVDGWNAKVHSIFRGNNFSEVLAGIEVLKRHNFSFGLKTVVHEGNFDGIKKMLDLCLKVGAEGWSYNLLLRKGRSEKNSTITELDVIKKIIPYYNTRKYRKLLNGNNVIIYYLFMKGGIDTFPLYFYIHYDSVAYITDTTVPGRMLGSVEKKGQRELNNLFSHSKSLSTNLERKISREVLEYTVNNLIL